MKKRFKLIMVALFVSFAFVLSACGGTAGQLETNANINLGSEESYVAATSDQVTGLTNYMAEAEPTEINKYRLTVLMETAMGDITYNAIMGYTQDDVQLAAKMTVESADPQDADGNVTAYMYYNDGVAAISGEMGGTTVKQKANLPQGTSITDNSYMGVLFSFDFNFITTNFSGVDFSADGTTVKVSTEGDITRYEVVADLDGEQATMYFVFDGENLAQCQISSAIEMYGMPADIIVSLEGFAGEIEFPSFDSYTLVDYAEFGMME